jgi:arginine/serine-rich splicing factor 4/5/6/transcription factor SPN1
LCNSPEESEDSDAGLYDTPDKTREAVKSKKRDRTTRNRSRKTRKRSRKTRKRSRKTRKRSRKTRKRGRKTGKRSSSKRTRRFRS